MAVRPVRAGARRPGSPGDVPDVALRMLDAMPVPAALLRTDGVLVAFNSAWEEAATPAGLVSTRDAPGQDHLTDLESGKGFAHDAGQAVAAVVRKAARGGRHTVDYALDHDGERQLWTARAEAIELEGSDHVLLVHQERTDAEQARALAERLEETGVALNRARAVAQDRSNLLHGALQEFHGPITPIQLQLHLLQSGGLGPLTDRQKTALERVHRNVRRWWNLQENLLGALQGLERTDEATRVVDARDLLDEAVPPFADRSIASGIKLRVERPEDALPVDVTPRNLVQVLLMLIDHAVRVTPSGGQVWVRARAVGDQTELSIQDQDPFMEPRVAQHLLDRTELRGADAGEEGDQALRSGLLYAHSVLERMGGRLEVACGGAGEGLEVMLYLPLALPGPHD